MKYIYAMSQWSFGNLQKSIFLMQGYFIKHFFCKKSPLIREGFESHLKPFFFPFSKTCHWTSRPTWLTASPAGPNLFENKTFFPF